MPPFSSASRVCAVFPQSKGQNVWSSTAWFKCKDIAGHRVCEQTLIFCLVQVLFVATEDDSKKKSKVCSFNVFVAKDKTKVLVFGIRNIASFWNKENNQC